jgi:hypothetical protein
MLLKIDLEANSLSIIKCLTLNSMKKKINKIVTSKYSMSIMYKDFLYIQIKKLIETFSRIARVWD